MTISSSTRKAGPFSGTGTTGPFAFAFKVFVAADLYVVKLQSSTGVETVLALNTDYSVSLNADQNAHPGGTVTLASALTTGYTVTLTSLLDYTQETDLTNQGGFYPAVITNSLDKLTILTQQLNDAMGRSVKTSVTTPDGVSTQLPAPAINKVVGWDNTGVALRNWDVNELVTSVAYGSAKADIFTGDGATVDFYLSANPANINNLDVSVGGVCQTPGADYTWVSGTKVTFTTAPPNGVTILIRYMQALPQGTVDAPSVSYTATGTGAVQRTGQSKFGESVSVKDFGAKGDGTTDDASAINFAIATGKTVYFPKGTYSISSPLVVSTKGQILYGDGRQNSLIVPSATFPLASLGVIVFSSGEEGPQLRDLKIKLTQPDTSTRANLTAWPPAIYAVDTPRFTIHNCAISNAMTGINMTGNSGGAIIDTLELSAYNIGIEIDGALDSVYIEKFHFWNFDMTSNQLSIFRDSSTIGIKCGKMDDLHLSESLFINGGKQIYFWRTGSGGSVFGNITNCGFDTYGRIVIEDGTISISGSQFTASDSTQNFITQSGGYLRITNSEFSGTANGYSSPLITVNDTGAGTVGSYFELSNSIFRLSGNATFLQSSATSPERATIIMSGNQFVVTPNIVRTLPMIDVNAGSRVTIFGNRATDIGTGSGYLIDVAEDEGHIITNNQFLGWSLLLPSTITSSRVFYNSGTSDYVNGYTVGTPTIKYLTGSLDGSGNITVAHGVNSPHLTAIQVQGFYKGNSGELKTLTFGYADGTNINFTGGVAGRSYRIAITYTVTSQSPW